MKRLFSIVIFCCALLLVACESHQKIGGCADPSMGMCIVKFTSPEYLDSVVVERDYVSGDSCQIRRLGGFGTCQEFFLGHSPYIALPDGYYLVDWKWGDFFYVRSNFIINVKWTEVTDILQKWEYPTGNVNRHFFKMVGRTSYKRIDNYFGETYGGRNYEVVPLQYHTISDVPPFERRNLYKQVAIQDSLQEVYKERLSRVIEEGALDNVLYYIMYE